MVTVAPTATATSVHQTLDVVLVRHSKSVRLDQTVTPTKPRLVVGDVTTDIATNVLPTYECV